MLQLISLWFPPVPKVEGSIGFIRTVWLAECVNKAKVWRKNHRSL